MASRRLVPERPEGVEEWSAQDAEPRIAWFLRSKNAPRKRKILFQVDHKKHDVAVTDAGDAACLAQS